MTEEKEQSSEAPVESQAPEGETEAQEETLEDVYSEFSVDEAAQQFQAQPVQSAPQPVTQQPDPYVDYEDQQRQQESNALRGEITQAVNEVQKIKQELQQQKVEADIGKAVDQVSKKVEGVDRDVIDAFLNSKANKDPRFMKLWDNREANPQAWSRGLDALSNEMSKKFTIKQDPQLTENQRAVQTSQKTMAGTNKTASETERWAEMSDEDIEKEVSAIKQSGYF